MWVKLRMFAWRRKSRGAKAARALALARLKAAEARRDTRDIGHARDDARAATTALLRTEMRR